ncbi:Oligosaccharyltransferase subunit Ribophorin II-domain-containing protein [Xylariomycetidae sp. FL2044]|nr:Oligosaccharyltransferase subunit Ribophorin II-domain-containing protein [Xylariomycetidae sp. FL2044]
MRFVKSFVTPMLLLLAAGAAQAASSWGFDDATVAVGSKKGGAGNKEKFSEKAPLSTSLTLGAGESLKVLLTAKEGGKGKRPHQAFVVLKEPESGLEAPFPLTVKENGKAVVEIKHSELPTQLATASSPLQASLLLASFGSSEGLDKPIFELAVANDPNATPLVSEKPLRYGKREEIRHSFRSDPSSPPLLITVIFVLGVVVTVPALYVCWSSLGANLEHLPSALSAAPVAHGVFFGSIVAMEAVFYLYYLSWSLFQVLPVIGLLGAATFLSGTKALGEVQSRRLAGER